MTHIIRDVKTWREYSNQLPKNKTLGFVPTMGNLHAGHESLLQRAKQENDVTVLSIFVNPTQFNDKNDLANYPRTEAQDIALAEKLNIDAVFIPTETELYPDGYRYQVHETDISQLLEGVIRPGHFTGMLTVVLKLLQIIKADRAYFGEKDYQQLLLVKGLVQAFFVETEIIGCPIVRMPEGLPLSSRNSRLSPDDLKHAAKFSQILQQKISIEQIKKELITAGFEIDYLEDKFNRRLAAVKFKNVRLLDNVN
ncbi:MAG: pantoate--beta-alanine ligase [Gammaproteobacteria bacterium]|jgi:pantoate--beta-alanine ligase